jgi:hypothetical protein
LIFQIERNPMPLILGSYACAFVVCKATLF